ncbi:MAG: glycosyltransferase family 2 protein [Candidatus Binatia bacterium]
MTTTAKSAPVTVIVPCHNEEAGLPGLLSRLCALRRKPQTSGWQFLFVDDGSTDGTFATLLKAARDEPGIQVMRHHENLGLGAALRTGFLHASSPIICTIDSDCTYAPERLPELTALVDHGADVVTASAWHPESHDAQGSALRLTLSRMVSRIYKLLIGQDVYTFTCLFRAYRSQVVRTMHFRADGFAAVAEIMLRAILAGRTIMEVPMHLEARRYGESKLKISDAVLAHAGLLTLTALAVSTRQVRQVLSRRSQ